MKKSMLVAMLAMAGLTMSAWAEHEHCSEKAAPEADKPMQQVQMNMLGKDGDKPVGYIALQQTKYGLALYPHMEGLAPGLHGFHIHAGDSCGPTEKDGKVVLGGAAKGHYDPDNKGKHGLPWTDDNHKGDLPALYVDTSGVAEYPVLAPRLTLEEVQGKSIMVHVGGDNHSDTPAPLGGGGARYVCGVIR